MTELLDQLERALSKEYRIDRALGGGMSRVFVAEELRLGRKVVLKVLAPELAGGVNVERFEREIRLAAQLQHPHIVPVLNAGSAGDIPFYVMPYIEGESLGARLARDGELPLPEAIRLLREVLDALAYAHQHGVVHRDIKPDNILLTAGHALVADFGVAKAVSAATGDARLTSTGASIGTPAYMAPEQIAAEPNVDSRVDIYATGVLAFEMVTGLSPFRGATTQAVLAAHMTQAAPSLTTFRQTVPAALDAIVLRCLAKRPSDRFQTAVEIIPLLDAINATATHPIPETKTTALAQSGMSSTTHRSPLRVLALFGIASLAILGVVWGLVSALGIPDWVFQSAVALLVAGLPILLVTNRRAGSQSTAGGHNTAPTGVARLFTWRRSIQGGVLAFAGLALTTAAFMTSRALGIGPGATLVSAGVLAPRDRIVIADFENRTSDSTLGFTVTQLVRIDLTQSPLILVMEPTQVGEALARMKKDRASDVTPDVAREIASREGIKAYLTGELLPAGTGYVIVAKLVNPSNGEALVSMRQSISSPEKLMAGIDKLSSKLREEVGESLRSVRADPPLEQVTTSSLVALRLYAEAERMSDRAGNDRAIALLQQAVSVDSDFAMAWRRLGVYSANAGRGPLSQARGDTAIRRAYALRHRLPDRERLFVEAALAGQPGGDPERESTAYLSILERYPNDGTALNNLAVIEGQRGRMTESIATSRRAIAAHVAGAITYRNAATNASSLGRVEAADTLLRQFRDAFPESFDLRATTISIAIDRQDFRLADSVAQVMLEGTPEDRAFAHHTLAATAGVAGRMADASRELRDGLRVEESQGTIAPAEATMLAQVADIERTADYTSEPKQATRRLVALWEQNRVLTAQRPWIRRRYTTFAPLFARLGEPARAQQMMDELIGSMSERDYPAVAAHLNTRIALATIATAAGQPSKAVTIIRDECASMPQNLALCDQLAFLELAQAYDKAGQADSAIAAYRRFVGLKATRYRARTPAFDAVNPKLAPAWRRLGELLESKGEKRQAIEAYERFLDYWRNADPEYQPIVRALRERVDRLRRATG